MLQDAEAGRPLEIDALVGAVREIGSHVGIATPNVDALLGHKCLPARGCGACTEAEGRSAGGLAGSAAGRVRRHPIRSINQCIDLFLYMIRRIDFSAMSHRREEASGGAFFCNCPILIHWMNFIPAGFPLLDS